MSTIAIQRYQQSPERIGPWQTSAEAVAYSIATGDPMALRRAGQSAATAAPRR